MSATVIGILLVVLSTVFDSFGEVSLKKSRLDRARQAHWIGAAVAFFIVQMGLYSVALRYLGVGAAFGIASLSFVMVALLSKFVLREAVTPIRWLGVCLIVTGTILIGGDA
jgi:multidrug transporter EmrE-like cation transporter